MARVIDRFHNAENAKGDVILWADTFNNYLMPHTAKAALAVLQDAGYRVRVPQQHLCCGRPLYDFGMLNEAKTYLRNILSTLAPDIERGTPIVCLEPSCASVFHDELRNLFPNDELAKKLSKQVVLFADFLHNSGYAPAQLNLQRRPRKQSPEPLNAIIHGHCHHKALWDMSPEKNPLQSAGLQSHLLDSGCCGLAGSFGYESEHHDISMKIGERVLLPAIRDAEPDTLIVADGFSCRQQIAHGTSRKAMHTAEVLALALESQQNPLPSPTKRRVIETNHTQPEPSLTLPLLLGLGALAGAVLLLRRKR